MDCSSPGSSVHGILQARKREWVVISFSRGFPGSNPHLLHWQADSLPLSHKGSPQEWIPSIHCKVPGKISLWLCQGEKKSIHRERVQLCATPKHNYEILFQQDEGNSCLLQLFPGSSAGKESTCNVGDLGLIPGLGISSGEGKGYPLQYSGLENSMDCIVHGVTKNQMQLPLSLFTFFPAFSIFLSHLWGKPEINRKQGFKDIN